MSIGTKSYKVIFAKSNLTATGLATKESDYGDYFAWGVAVPNYESYTRIGSGSSVTVKVDAWKEDKPNGYNYDPTLSKTYGDGEDLVMADDPARKILGGDWQVPTETIWKALQTAINAQTISSSNGSEVIIDGIKGRKFTKTDDSITYIFLPHAGTLQKKDYYYGDYFPYWTSTAYRDNTIYCFDISGKSTSMYTCFTATDRRWGMPIRAVRLVAE